MTMSRTKSKLFAASVAAGCALGLTALKGAWATPQQGVATTILTGGPISLDEIDVHTDTDGHKVKVKTKGVSDIYVVRNVIAPGGHTGWHSHPGPSIISVVSGTATAYEGDDPQGFVFPAGTAFADSGDHRHIIRNEGTTNLELIAFQILPEGATRRIDEPAP
jgi:mannose-6-phosphate isomerase-like protein (cupin superfamily)